RTFRCTGWGRPRICTAWRCSSPRRRRATSPACTWWPTAATCWDQRINFLLSSPGLTRQSIDRTCWMPGSSPGQDEKRIEVARWLRPWARRAELDDDAVRIAQIAHRLLPRLGLGLFHHGGAGRDRALPILLQRIGVEREECRGGRIVRPHRPRWQIAEKLVAGDERLAEERQQ